MRANDLPTCKVSLSIDDDNRKQPLYILPKTTVRSWAMWDTISIPRATLEYRRRRANVVRWKAEAQNEAKETTQLWDKV